MSPCYKMLKSLISNNQKDPAKRQTAKILKPGAAFNAMPPARVDLAKNSSIATAPLTPPPRNKFPPLSLGGIPFKQKYQIMSEKLTKEEKARRMAEALRENLRKRKQQQRERDTPLERDAQAPAN